MKLDRDLVWSMLLAVAALGMGAWIVMNTHWVDEEIRDPAQGEAAKDRHYAIKRIVQRLGGTTQSPPNLDRLPPTNATLVLSSWNWDLLPERDKALRAWVESGGHLVSEQWKRPQWIPIERKNADDKAAKRPRVEPASAARAGGPLIALPRALDCHEVTETDSAPPTFGTRRGFRLCNGMQGIFLRSSQPPIWSLDGINGPSAFRVQMGHGAATVVLGPVSESQAVFEGDHALAFIAALDLQHRPEVWFVDTESRDPLLKLIWRQGMPAVLLGFALIALALWRGMGLEDLCERLLPVGRVQGTPGLQAPTTTLMRVA